MFIKQNNEDCIEIETSENPDKSVIWLHGLGADGSDFVPIIPEMNLPTSLRLRFIFPHAPVMPVTINNGYETRAWFDIYSLSVESRMDMEGIAKSVAYIETFIEKERTRGIASKDILIAGFSQGAAIAMCTGIHCKQQLAGIIALSGYLPQAGQVLAEGSAANRQIPIFLAHGTEDPVVPYPLGVVTHEALQQSGYPVTWRSYNIPHTVSPEEVNDISSWMQGVWSN